MLRRRAMTRRWGWIVAAAIELAAPLCLAGPASQLEADKAAAIVAFRLGHYQRAIEAFDRAYKASQDHRLLFNLAMCYRKRFDVEGERGDLVRACDFYRLFLSLARSAPGRSDHAKVELARRVAEEKRRECARLLAGSRERSPAPSSAPAMPTPVVPKVNGARSTAAPAALAAPPRPRPPAAPERRRLPARVWVVYGAAAALVAGATVTGALAVGADSDARAAFDRGDRAANAAAVERTRDLALTTDVLAAVAAGAALAGILLHWRAARARAVVGGGWVGVAGAF